ncbi:MAG: IS4 family transposase [Erysipelotrichia bacterium]|nr:IS4 family transposase [Erysipelotrichia bacterium]NCC55629.1 IS4 family transposase [Erysipelotrichia bacterium]
MNNISLYHLNSLESIINDLSLAPCFDHLIYDSSKNFTRNSKFGLVNTIRFILASEPTTLKNEIKNYFEDSSNLVAAGAIVQSRDKMKPALFRFVFDELNRRNPISNVFKGYHLIAVDGSKLNIPYNPKDTSSFHRGKPKADGTYGKGYNQLHLSTAYDILNDRYLDALIKDILDYDERKAMLDMVKRYNGKQAIFIADRGYEGANLIENLKQMTKFVIRVKDIHSSGNSILKNSNLPDEEFDLDVHFTFTNYNRKEYQLQKEKYKITHKQQSFDFLDDTIHFYETSWRVVRFKIGNEYEAIITNLDRDEFPALEIKELYHLRWNTETTFGHLKHSLNFTCFISEKKEFIHQEIWAKLTMYNVCALIINSLEKQRTHKRKKKHIHQINVSNAVHLLISTFRKGKRTGGIPPDLDMSIMKETLPVREGRKYARSPHPHTYPASNYRHY